jgi:hypothetical protein
MGIDWKVRRTGWGRRDPDLQAFAHHGDNAAWLSFLTELQECLGDNGTIKEAIAFVQRQTIEKQAEVPQGGSDD